MILLVNIAVKVAGIAGLGLLSLILLRRQSASLRHCVLAAALAAAAAVPPLTLIAPQWSAGVSAPALLSAPPQQRSQPQPAVSSEVVDRLAETRQEGASSSVPPVQPLKEPVSAGEASLPGATAEPFEPPAQVHVAAPVSEPSAPGRQQWLDPAIWIVILWSAGAATGIAFLAAGAIRVRAIASGCPEVRGEAWTAIEQEMRLAYRVRRRFRILQTRHPSVLATWGILRPEILLPAGAQDWTEDRIRVVLAHELAHIRRGDWPLQILASLLRAVYWFNPLLWIACSRLRQESEQACDDIVLAQGIGREGYAVHLLALARSLKAGGRHWTAALSMARPAALQKRIQALLDSGINRRRTGRAATAFILILFFCTATAVAGLRFAQSPLQVLAPVSQIPGVQQLSALLGVPATGASAPEPTAATPVQSSRGPAIRGTVTRLGGNDPVAGAFVELRKYECGESGVPGEVYTALTGRPNPYWSPAPAAGSVAVLTETSRDDGRFAFEGLTAGAYCIVAYRPNSEYFPAEYQQRGYGGHGVTIRLAENQELPDVRLALIPSGSISGRILDGNGEPVAHARVLALEPFYYFGERRLNPVITLQTNDLGEFRLFWLRPGQYYIAATLEDPQRRTIRFAMYPPGRGGRYEDLIYPIVSSRELEDGSVSEETYTYVYYGGGTDVRRARPVDVGPGASINGIDFTMTPARLRSWRVTGTVFNAATGQSVANASVRLLPQEWIANPIVPSAFSGADGSFVISGVIPGAYQLYATGRSAPARGGARNSFEATPSPELVARIPLRVGDGDLTSLKVPVQAGFRISGKVRIEGDGPDGPADTAAALRLIRVFPYRDPDIVGQPTALLQREPSPANAEGAFVLEGIGPGDYRVFVEPLYQRHLLVPTPPAPPALQDMYVKSAQLGSVDVLSEGLHLTGAPDVPLEVVIAKGARLSGRAVDTMQQPVANVTVALIPDAPRRRPDRYKMARTDAEGRFQIAGVAPGSYKLFAWEYVEEDSWFDSEVLSSIEGRGKTIRIEEAGAATVDVPVIWR